MTITGNFERFQFCNSETNFEKLLTKECISRLSRLKFCFFPIVYLRYLCNLAQRIEEIFIYNKYQGFEIR